MVWICIQITPAKILKNLHSTTENPICLLTQTESLRLANMEEPEHNGNGKTKRLRLLECHWTVHLNLIMKCLWLKKGTFLQVHHSGLCLTWKITIKWEYSPCKWSNSDHVPHCGWTTAPGITSSITANRMRPNTNPGSRQNTHTALTLLTFQHLGFFLVQFKLSRRNNTFLV